MQHFKENTFYLVQAEKPNVQKLGMREPRSFTRDALAWMTNIVPITGDVYEHPKAYGLQKNPTDEEIIAVAKAEKRRIIIEMVARAEKMRISLPIFQNYK